MNSPERVSPEARKPVAGYLWGLLAALTCPCHLPVLAIVLAGTTAGAFLGKYWGIAAFGLTGLFVLSLARAMRAFSAAKFPVPINPPKLFNSSASASGADQTMDICCPASGNQARTPSARNHCQAVL